MNEITPEELEDAILSITDLPAWHTIVQGKLADEIQIAQNNMVHAKDWNEIVEAKGFIRGLVFVATLREQLEAVQRANL